MARSIKKGPYVAAHSKTKLLRSMTVNQKGRDQNLEPSSTHHS
jgi:hypothetical protein